MAPVRHLLEAAANTQEAEGKKQRSEIRGQKSGASELRCVWMSMDI